jgi:murein L,D-transpeptidase YafK
MQDMKPEMIKSRPLTRPFVAGAALLMLALASGCTTSALDIEPETDISASLARQIAAKGFRQEDPVLIRIFKAESELEVWKRKSNGQYALFKTYPICRWSGKLGPKRQNGDRQAPEGFYSVNLAQLNPKSHYYLSFNLGFPNRLETALNYSGEALMVHGACSSSGCFALTDQNMAEIYPIVLKALKSGQPAFQVQSYPFRMTDGNMRLHAADPNTSFWSTLKVGYDSFERNRSQPKVAACSGHYVFDQPDGMIGDDPLAACPPGVEIKTAPLMAFSTSSAVNAYSYQDGGMHKSYRILLERYGPKRLATKVSSSKYPISRPEAALADPFNPQ